VLLKKSLKIKNETIIKIFIVIVLYLFFYLISLFIGLFVDEPDPSLMEEKIANVNRLVSKVSKEFDGKGWELGKPRIQNPSEFLFSNGEISLSNCEAKHFEKKINSLTNEFELIKINYHKYEKNPENVQMFCLDNSILIIFRNFSQYNCSISVKVEWRKNMRCTYSNNGYLIY
jgi:hypothetical protein